MVTIRPATCSDLPQIQSINTYYIQNTSLTFKQTPPPASTHAAKLSDQIARGLPYLVAIENYIDTANEPNQALGYASLSPFRGHLASYAPTVELTLFVHPEYQSRGVGSSLLAALLDRVRRGEVRHRPGEEGVPDAPGDGVPVRNVLAVMAVDPEGMDGGEALRRWYLRRGFVERGRLVRVGFKRGHW